MGYFTDRAYGARIFGWRMVGALVLAVALALLWPLMLKLGEMPGSPQLQQGQRVIYQMAGRQNLRQVGFFEQYSNPGPSDFVTMISNPDHKLWPPPPSNDPTLDARAPGKRVLMPDGVVFSTYDRRVTDTDEIVVVPDDGARQLIVRGFSPGEEEPTFEYVWDFPTKAGQVSLH